MSEIYEWLRSKQTVVSPSGLTYEIRKMREAADEIERLEIALAETRALLDDCQERLSEVLHDLDESHRMTTPTPEGHA